MSQPFNIAAYGASALYYDPNGVLSPKFQETRFLAAGLPILLGRPGIAKSVISAYTGFLGETNGRRTNTIKTIPVRVGMRFGLFPMGWNYLTGT